MPIRGALGSSERLMSMGSVVLHRQHSHGWKRTPKQPSCPPALGIPPTWGHARQSHVPSPGTDLLSCLWVYRTHKFSNFPGEMKWAPWGPYGRCFHCDALCLFCCISLGSNVSFSHWTWPWEILNAKSIWAQEGDGLLPSLFSPLQTSHLHPQKKAGSFPMHMRIYKQPCTAHIYI